MSDDLLPAFFCLIAFCLGFVMGDKHGVKKNLIQTHNAAVNAAASFAYRAGRYDIQNLIWTLRVKDS